ncbi:MAG: hypothetical protein SA339_05760 [Methanomassiliicoccus sp.]|nr:hypothetical protein [Methanomassiliicoccus sp.]
MAAHDEQLVDHRKRIERIELIVWGVVAVTLIGMSLWFAHLAGVVPGVSP